MGSKNKIITPIISVLAIVIIFLIATVILEMYEADWKDVDVTSVLQIAIAVSLPLVLGLLRYVANKQEEHRLEVEIKATQDTVKNEALFDLVRSLVRDRLFDKCQMYIEKGEITVHQYDMLKEYKDKYGIINGNGTCGKQIDIALALDMVPNR